MVNNLKKHAMSHMIVSIFAFAFSVIIMALIAADFDGAFIADVDAAKNVTSSIFVLSMFLFGIFVAILAIWTFLYNRLKQNEMIKKIMLGFLISIGIAALYIMAIMIVNVSIASITDSNPKFILPKDAGGNGGWLAVNVVVTAFTLLGMILSIVSYAKVKKVSQKVQKVKAKIQERDAE